MPETLFEELKRYVGFGPADERALARMHAVAAPHFRAITTVFYSQIFEHPSARKALEGGESQVGELKEKLILWLGRLFSGPWDEQYFELRCRIGRVHVRVELPQHYMFGAMNVIRRELDVVIDRDLAGDPALQLAARAALSRILDVELAIMLHTYREDYLVQQARTERLATFGQLAGSIGHELRNPLGVIETSLFLLKGRIGDDERARKHVARIGEQVGLANEIVSDLLDIIRDRPLARERLVLESVIAAAVEQVPRPPAVKLELSGLADSHWLDGDPSQLRQVFVNLIDNAVHAAGPEGTVRVIGFREGALLGIAVEDTGPGVDPAIRRRLFEPLVTTKVKGIGLGLALVRRIVDRHGGSVICEPAKQGGARFVVRLPPGSTP